MTEQGGALKWALQLFVQRDKRWLSPFLSKGVIPRKVSDRVVAPIAHPILGHIPVAQRGVEIGFYLKPRRSGEKDKKDAQVSFDCSIVSAWV